MGARAPQRAFGALARLFLFRAGPAIGLSGPAPLQAPQAARREDDGDGRGHAERDEGPNPEKNSTGIGDPAADKSRPPHVDDKDAQPSDRPEEHDDVPRS